MSSRLEDLIVYLNELIKLDRDAITDLCNDRVKVNNNGLLEHPTVQCLICGSELVLGKVIDFGVTPG